MNKWGVAVSWASCMPVAWAMLSQVDKPPAWWYFPLMLGAGTAWFSGILMILLLPSSPEKP